MGFCEFCKKWVNQPEGKKQKRFCNETCRSNFWYAKNKKGKYIEIAAPKKEYDAPKLPDNKIDDEYLSFEKLRQQAAQKQSTLPKTVPQYMKWKRDIESEEEYRQLCAEVDANPMLTRKEKEFCKTANPSQL